MSVDHEFAGSRFLGKNFNLNKLKITDSSFVVASVEAGNTTTKCILTATDLTTGKTDIIGKCVRLTRDIQKPADRSEVFGKTVSGTELTKETLSELVRDTIHQALFEKNLTPDDIHFVVRSTGVTAETGEQLEMIILALAEGCLLAGFSPRKMTGYLSLENMPDKLKPYSYLDRVYFDGAVAGVRPPAGFGEGIVSNEMEGELALAGLKEAGKHTGADLRNPCVAIDMGTTLSGRIADGSSPYAKTIANFCGYAGAVADAFLQNIAPEKSAYEWIQSENAAGPPENTFSVVEKAAAESMKYIHVIKIPETRKQFGPFTVNVAASKNAGTLLFGCDVGENGSDLKKLAEIGENVYKTTGTEAVSALIDDVMSEITVQLIDCIRKEGLLTDETLIGITGRAGITGLKKEKIIQKLKSRGILENPDKKLIFAEDGLARGAAVMARCMNSLGCPNNPIGGRRGGKCIMQERRELQNMRR
ncbi:methanogenesis marker 14 protein [Methanimicrococcus blatticola]|uniref:Putative methanogenesis marker protein 14 n=1 Tax=Methanimicrococcus blatticola TaxID=91560 RepID=A0A484F5T2_9EURY|nr:methanogenesis marker 14 protein [Methanimicrococcus blatticola]MBZ3936302.1 methanogenesis marker 14 protein [Methanimicrococcus blatticola]MCC2508305.1 methanogenesis marker 14 protein [Methanimicrococcus blatticola]TDQ70240.1 putative methanogenesis marker protein 14 [Methanimicrococcus blatticola]